MNEERKSSISIGTNLGGPDMKERGKKNPWKSATNPSIEMKKKSE